MEICKNKRIPLPDGTMLTKDIVIVSLISDSGGSALVYKAKKGDYYTIVKEFFPYMSRIPIERDSDGMKLISKGTPKDELDEYINNSVYSFNEEMKNSALANKAYDNNSIHSFPCTDINEMVQRNPLFSGTIALYMEIETRSGRTLFEEIKFLSSENAENDINVEQAIVLTKKILSALESKHNVQHLLHLDIKPDNIYFLDEPGWRDTLCIFLDCGNYQPINHVSSDYGFSATAGYASYEVKKILKYLDPKSGITGADHAVKKYIKYIGTQTDLYSVGVIFLQLIMGKDFDISIFDGIEKSSQKSLYQKLRIALTRRFETSIPYIIEKTFYILCKALYIPNSYDDLIVNRYTKCEDFIADIDELLKIYNAKGIHPEIIDANSHKQFMNVIKLVGISVASNRTSEELIKDETLLDSRLFPEVIIVSDK